MRENSGEMGVVVAEELLDFLKSLHQHNLNT